MITSDNNCTKKIAFFDSGMGGLTVLHKALKILPYEEYIYFADSNNAPYGTKSTTQIKDLVFDAVDFLVQQDLKALVLACNTATSVAIKDLRQKYKLPIIGMEPAVKLAVESSENKKILVCATQKTLAENKLQTLIENLKAVDQVVQLSLQELVVFAERFDLENPAVETYLQERFDSINWVEFDSIVLGCTHFPYFKNQIKKIIPSNIRILDGNLGTVKHLQQKITPTTNTEPLPIQYYISKEATPASYFNRYFDFLNLEVKC